MKITKYSDIPQLTNRGSYQINMPLPYLSKWLNTMVEESGLQLNPDFQRGHVWTEEQQIKYIEYLLRGGKSSRVIYFNCPSWQRENTTEYDDFVCVDGLQRLTAITAFLNNKIKVFDSYCNEFEDKIPLDVDVLLNVNNLQTKQEVLKWYIEMNEGGTPHTAEEIDRVKRVLFEEAGRNEQI